MCLQGALDGGLDIPHSDKRFAGFDKDKKELDADVHRKYVFGGHVASYIKVLAKIVFSTSLLKCLVQYYYYLRNEFWQTILYVMQTLIEDEPEKYQSHFSAYIKEGIEPDGLEDLYKKVHAAIRADPIFKKSEKQAPKEHKR